MPRDRQKRPDSVTTYETVRRDRTRPYAKRPSEETGLYSKLEDPWSSSPTARDERSEILLVDVRWTAFLYPLAAPTMQRAERSQASWI